jgi:hypothetical protein
MSSAIGRIVRLNVHLYLESIYLIVIININNYGFLKGVGSIEGLSVLTIK